MKVLFVCTANRDRSLTAQHVFEGLNTPHTYDSCGTHKYYTANCFRYNGKSKHITGNLCEWADKIICMEQEHVDYIISKIDIKYKEKIACIDLEDTRYYGDPELIRILQERINPLL